MLKRQNDHQKSDVVQVPVHNVEGVEDCLIEEEWWRIFSCILLDRSYHHRPLLEI